MQTTTAKAVYAYWSRVRGGRDVPNRRDIEPADLRQFLPDLFILEQTPDSGTTFRLAGTRLCTLFGRELRAAGLQRLFAPDVRARISRICTNIMAQRTPAALQVSAYGRTAQPTAIEILLLPMTSHSPHADRIFGALCPVNPVQPLEMPFRYMTVDTVSNIDHAQENAFLQARPPVSLPTSVMAVRRHDFGQVVRRVLHLRVFDGGR
ncbi:PAS domain-containing protein [Rhizobium sp. ARZ01]|uniref:PAS domain-containing protein n=1 Tax=Rhizobium sp. ARZ01 TaxID=2769313 RepID=UPI0017825236|nr:PAS domain-containing protein [Rhizobium sp. ARZ01]MBD9372476.1 PAS domain-containing protein [Rhizobium sp. ARZ01]